MSLTFKLYFGIGLLVVAAFGYLLIARANLRAELASATAEVAGLRVANDGFRDAMMRQTAALAVVQAESNLRAKRAAAALQMADTSARRLEKAAHKFALKKLTGEPCRMAERLIDAYRVDKP